MKRKKLVNIIRYVGLKNLDDKEQDIIKRILDHGYERVHRLIKTITNLVFYIKTYETSGKIVNGKIKKYSIRLRVESPARMFNASSYDWDLARAVHKVLQNVEKQIEHRFKIEEPRQQLMKLKKILRKAEKIRKI